MEIFKKKDNGFQPLTITAQTMKFSIKDFFSKCDQIHSFLRIWSRFLQKSLMENFIFCAAYLVIFAKSSILDVWQGSELASGVYTLFPKAPLPLRLPKLNGTAWKLSVFIVILVCIFQ